MCSDWVPPSTAPSPCSATRTRLTSGCCAVSCTPAVWVWKRSIMRLGVLGAELVAHDPRPDPPGGAELRDLLEQRRARDEEERQPRREVVDVQARRRCAARTYSMRVGEGERDLLRGRRPGLGHVVAGDGDGVPARDLLAAVGEDVGDQPQRLRRRVDVGAAGDVLLEHVVLDRAGELRRRRRPAPRRRAGRAAAASRPGALIVIDVETSSSGMPSNSDAHVVDRVDRDADLADLAVRDRRRRSRSPSGSAGRRRPTARRCRRDQLVVALVGLLGGAEPGVLPHRPRAGRCTSTGRRRGCTGTRPGSPSCAAGSKPGEVVRRRRPARSAGRTPWSRCFGDVGGHAAHDSERGMPRGHRPVAHLTPVGAVGTPAQAAPTELGRRSSHSRSSAAASPR